MANKKQVKKVYSTIILGCIIFILVIALGILYYYGFIENKKQINSLINQNEKLEAKVNELELNISQEQKADKTTQTVASNKIQYEKMYISPKFYYGDGTKEGCENIENWEYDSFMFKEDGTVYYYAYETRYTGKYELQDNGTINVNIGHYDCEPGAIYNEPIEYTVELKIIDENTIIGNTMDIYSDEINNISFEYRSPYKVVYTVYSE